MASRVASLGEGFATIRYDQRGTGASGGSASLGEPEAECRDCAAVARWARRALGAERVFACGVSFGAVVAAAAAGRFAEIDGCACVSYPVDYVWFLTLFRASAWRAPVEASPKPKLFVWGRKDAYAALAGDGAAWDV